MTGLPSRLAEALADRYRIERELGAGGMATVYLADDLKHHRKVALKVLKPELAAVVGAERFVAEIRTTANLQHPHILPLFDSGEADGFLYYVMPYIEGETLRDRLDREKQLPVDEAVRIATAVAGALEVAHEAGVVHRDIKPANVLLSRGQPLVADFGIALAVGNAGGNRLTETGLSVGTPYYMSPEQATGDRQVGPASDVYALGCVLYEMLVGDPPFGGSTAQAVLGKILQGDAPSASAARPTIPPNVDGTIRRALEKLPADRFPTAADFARALGDPAFRYGETAGEPAARRGGAGFWRPLALGASAVAVAAAGFALGPRDESAGRPMHLELALPPGLQLVIGNGMNLDIAPDGSAIVFAADSGTEDALWVRRMDALSAVRLSGTDGARVPRFSPDGGAVAFVADGALRTTPLTGAPPLTLVQTGVAAGGGGLSWGDDGFIYYEGASGFRRIPEGGGMEEAVCPDVTATGFAWPDALPGGDALLLSRTGGGLAPGGTALVVLDIGSCELTELTPGTMGRFTPPGDLVYATTSGQVLVAPFVPAARRLTGAPRPILEGIQVNSGSASYVATSDDGVLAYVAGGVEDAPYPVVMDASGVVRSFPDVGRDGMLRHPAVSPDGRRVAFSYYTMDDRSIWILDLEEGTFAPLTLGEQDTDPFWSPDGTQVGFARQRAQTELWVAAADFSGAPRPIPGIPAGAMQAQWTPDGAALIVSYGNRDGVEGGALTWVPLDGSEGPRQLGESASSSGPSLSPDGRWVAFESRLSGRYEVYVMPVSGDGGRRQVSVGGGRYPRWAPAGDRIYFWNPDGAQVGYASVALDPDLAVTGRGVFTDDEDVFSFFDVLPDGRSLLIMTPETGADAGPRSPRVVTEWRNLLLGAGGGSR